MTSRSPSIAEDIELIRGAVERLLASGAYLALAELETAIIDARARQQVSLTERAHETLEGEQMPE